MPARDILRPMLASLAEAPLHDPAYVYEPKYDGIRAIVEVAPGGRIHLWSRLGNEKTGQFPEITAALDKWSRKLKAPLVLDGEIVALDANGEPAGFQQLQGRIHVIDVDDDAGAQQPGGSRVALIAFDLLKDNGADYRSRPLTERRALLEKIFSKTGSPLLRISDQVAGDGRALYERAMERGWEGLIAKVASSQYKSGKRSPDWRKLKIVQEQEFVVGGWTEPRQSREYFGALLLGVYADSPGDGGSEQRTGRARSQSRTANPQSLVYVGHTGTGFNEKELARVMKLLKPLETRESPFATKPKTNERPHWVAPKLVAQIKFTEWTADAKLRHPVYLGLRDDKKPEEVHREQTARLNAQSSSRLTPGADPAHGKAPAAAGERARPAPLKAPAGRSARSAGARRARTAPPDAARAGREDDAAAVLARLREIEDSRKEGVVALADGSRLELGNLHKIFWPGKKLTKGDLMRYYASVAPMLLPVVADRPLVMKRYPNGVDAKPFYQHKPPDTVPPGVRVEPVASEREADPRIIGGSLATLLYMTQLAAVSQDPWFSRVQSPGTADFVALDLDPSDGVPFTRVLDVARWIHDELDSLGAEAFPKTSGASGLHVFIPLPPGTPYDAGLLFCQIVATVVAQKHPREATVERAVRARGRRVYIDYLQNIRGKTLACAYSARASEYAGVSAPLTWREVHDGVDREAFTIETMPARLKDVGDLWKGLRESKGVDLSRVSRYAEK